VRSSKEKSTGPDDGAGPSEPKVPKLDTLDEGKAEDTEASNGDGDSSKVQNGDPLPEQETTAETDDLAPNQDTAGTAMDESGSIEDERKVESPSNNEDSGSGPD